MRAALGIAALCMAGGPSGGGDPPSADALRGIVEAYERADWESAASLADELLLRLEGTDVPERRVAEAHYARGVVLAGRAQAEPDSTEGGILAAVAPFESARALAGPGSLRLDATYDLGGVHLLEGERWRAQLPEVSGAQQPAQLPQAQAMTAAGAGGPAEEPPDPLEKARASYLAAKACLIERLRADWRDIDTRANLELIQRRLKELDEIERQRQEQQQEQQKQQDQQDQNGQQGQGENKPQDQEGDAQQQQNPSDQQQDADQESDPKEDQQQQGQKQDNDTQEVPRPEEGGEARTAEEGADLSERHLTREEVMRLLDRLADVEQEGEALQEMLRQARRVPVPRDW